MPDSWKLEWFRRCNDLLETYRPDYVYSDYGNVPFRREVGWQLLANYYNRSIADHGGRLEAVYTGKGDNESAFTCATSSPAPLGTCSPSRGRWTGASPISSTTSV